MFSQACVKMPLTPALTTDRVLAAERRASKLVSLITSCFTGNYVRHWAEHMLHVQLQSTPMFDGRAVLYPSDRNLRDYLAWRQVDTHINNQVETPDNALRSM